MKESGRVKYTIPKIAEVTGTTWEGPDQESVIRILLTDSRKSAFPEETLFFALTSGRNDGHKYIHDLFLRGFRFFVVRADFKMPDGTESCTIIRSENILETLQKLSTYHRSLFQIPVIGITGSNGKTVVKEWLSQLLNEDHKIVKSPKSFNSQTGVPLSVWQMESQHRMGIFEAGISLPGEMEKLRPIVNPTIGLFTNIGEAHAENFTSRSEKISEKLLLFNHAKILIYCRDYQDLDEQVRKTGIKTFSWSRFLRSDLQINRINRNEGTEIKAVYKNTFTSIKIPFTDDASIENAIHCWAVLLHLGYSEKIISERMQSLSPVEMRLELKEGINNCSVINDSYNSDTGSLAIALDFLNQQKQYDRKTLILSDILQTGKSEAELYKQVAEIAHSRGVTRIIGIGKAISNQSQAFLMDRTFYPDTDAFLDAFTPDMFINEVILLKGARVFGFERINQVLQQKAHETVLEVNLSALVHNLNYFRGILPQGTKIMAMVKAFSYGSGSFEIAGALQFHRIDYLAVAYADEGVELRRSGITVPIMVMNPEEQSYNVMIHYRLEPELFSLRVLKLFIKALKRQKKQGDTPYPVHLKLDTGMHRLGFEEEDLAEAIQKIKDCPALQIRSVFSHLAGSDDPKLDDFTNEQIRRFNTMATTITEELGYPVMRHILNSAGISRFPDASFEMVRLGIGMYGIGCSEKEQAQLQNVSTLKTTISQIKKIPKGETIGYGRAGKAEVLTTIATIPVGYADGLNRKLSNGVGKVYINGKVAPIIGNVCMDMTMVNITEIDAAEGDEVIVFGDEHPASEIAENLNTIPYEVFTSISRRVKRIFVQE